MAEDDSLPVSWREREVPLSPAAAVAVGPAAVRLARRMLEEGDERLTALRAAGGTADCVLLVSGDSAESLPWADGVFYLGRDPEAPSLLLPTNRAPDAPLPLVERALLARYPGTPAPVAVLPGPPKLRVVSVAGVRPVARRVLTAWAAAWEAALSRKGGGA